MVVQLGTIGEKLREIRNQKKLSLRQAARQIGISHTYLDTLEKERDPRTGEPVHPSIDVLERISKGYKIPLSEFLIMMGYDEQRLGIRHEGDVNRRTSDDIRDTGVDTIQEEKDDLPDIEAVIRGIESLPPKDRKVLLYLIKRLTGNPTS